MCVCCCCWGMRCTSAQYISVRAHSMFPHLLPSHCIVCDESMTAPTRKYTDANRRINAWRCSAKLSRIALCKCENNQVVAILNSVCSILQSIAGITCAYSTSCSCEAARRNMGCLCTMQSTYSVNRLPEWRDMALFSYIAAW